MCVHMCFDSRGILDWDKGVDGEGFFFKGDNFFKQMWEGGGYICIYMSGDYYSDTCM